MVQFSQASDVGQVRDHNEDNFLALPEKSLWLIADGMGGYEAGEVASAIVVEEVPKLLDQGMSLQEALEETHRSVHLAAEAGKGEPGMGSTAVALQLEGNSFEIAWVGDSRAYLWDGTSMMQLTRDHSFVQQLLDSGAISDQEALEHPQRNVISQALGAAMKNVRPDVVKGKLAKGDKILLCSDGLTSELSDQEISTIIAREKITQAATELLVEAANKKGGHDNITVILVEAPEDSSTRVDRGHTRPMSAVQGKKGSATKKAPNRSLVYGLAGFLLAVIPLAIWVNMGHHSPPVSKVGGGGASSVPLKVEKGGGDTKKVDVRKFLPGNQETNEQPSVVERHDLHDLEESEVQSPSSFVPEQSPPAEPGSSREKVIQEINSIEATDTEETQQTDILKEEEPLSALPVMKSSESLEVESKSSDKAEENNSREQKPTQETSLIEVPDAEESGTPLVQGKLKAPITPPAVKSTEPVEEKTGD